jgi:hypothetical protein
MEPKQESRQPTDKQRYWFNHITAAHSQNLSLAQYATQHNLSLKALYNWHWILKSKGLLGVPESNKPFVPVVRQRQPSMSELITHRYASVHLSFANDTQVELKIDSAELGTVLAMVKAL